MKHNKSLTAAQHRTIEANLRLINAQMIDSAQAIEFFASVEVESLIANYPTLFNEHDKPLYLAYAEIQLLQIAFKAGYINLYDYIQLYAKHKQAQFIDRNDFGAFGDLLEVLARIAIIGNLNLVKASHLSVKAIFKNDIMSKRYGIIEVAHNGKTWNEGTIENPIEGRYTSVIYGVFDAYTENQIFDACINRDIKQAIAIVRAYCVYWKDKNEFLQDMEGLTRGKFFTVKSCKIMNQYNQSKHNAFIRAIENGTFTTLETL